MAKTTSASKRERALSTPELKKANGLLKLSPARLREANEKLARFVKFTTMIETEDEQPFHLEGWQKLVLLAYFAGIAEILILIPKGNGKTCLLAALAVFHLLTEKHPEVYIGASNKTQAATMYNEARRMSQLHPAWRKKLIPRASTKHIYVGRNAEGGFLRVLSSDRLKAGEEGGDEGSGSLEGIKPTLGLVDELHAHVNDAIYAAIQGALHKRNGQMLTISTAGAEGSVLRRVLDAAKKLRGLITRGRLTVACTATFALFEWALNEKDDVDNMKVVKMANPSSFVTTKKLKDLRGSPSMTDTRWARRHCNRWVRSEGGWLEPALFDVCEREDLQEPPRDKPLILGYDHARSYDEAALVAVVPTSRGGEFVPIASYDTEANEGGHGQVFVINHFVPSEEDGGKVPYWKVKKAIRDACERFNVVAVGYDKLGGFSQSAEELADEGLPMVAVSMRSDVWGPLTAEMYAGIKSQRIHFAPHEKLRAHFLAAETKDTEYGERLHGKPKSKLHVDLAMGTGIAWYTAFFDAEAFEALDNPPTDLLGYRIQHI